MLQITDQRTLRKLSRRIDELLTVKTTLVDIANGMPTDYAATVVILDNLLLEKKVKENHHMTSLLQEIREYLGVGDKEAASKTAKRVLEVPPAVQTVKPANAR